MTIPTTTTTQTESQPEQRPAWSGLLAAWHIILGWIEEEAKKAEESEAANAA